MEGDLSLARMFQFANVTFAAGKLSIAWAQVILIRAKLKTMKGLDK